MARVRLIALVALCSCRVSEAAPNSGLTPPPGWSSLPSLATAARDAAKGGMLTVENAEAWGETSRGCYAAWLALAGGTHSRSALADDIVQGIEKEPALAGITVSELAKPADLEPDNLSLAFARKPYRGRLKAQLSKDGRVALLACFWNEREPATCEASCTALLGSMK